MRTPPRGSRRSIGMTCEKCGRAMVSRTRHLGELTSLLGTPPGATEWFCVVHGPWPPPVEGFAASPDKGEPR